jgi:hypothetical protein
MRPPLWIARLLPSPLIPLPAPVGPRRDRLAREIATGKLGRSFLTAAENARRFRAVLAADL